MNKNQYTTAGVPMGTIIAFALSSKNIPAGWLLCDGSQIPSKYQNLITALGMNTTPNLSGQTLIGTGESSSGTNYELGVIGGKEEHTLTIAQIPSHYHYGFGESHSDWPFGTSGSDDNMGSSGGIDNDNYYYNTSSAGGGESFNIMQPYYPVNYIIYTGQDD